MRSVVAGKARVHELAKELGVDSKTVLAKLQELGEYVKSASSTVEAPVARRLRVSLESGGAAPAAAAPSAPASTPSNEQRVSARPAPPRRPSPVPGPARKLTPPAAPAAPVVKPASAHDIEVAAAEARASALKAEQEAARAAAQSRPR